MNYKQTKSIGVKDLDSKQKIVTAYISAFGNIDSDGDIIQKGAFTKTIHERMPKNMIKMLYQHDRTKLPGKVLSLEQDDFGLLAQFQLIDTTLGKDTFIEYEMGVLTEHSIGYDVVKYRKEDRDERTVYVLEELKLFEGSPVTWGANSNTPVVGIKGEDDILNALEKANLLLKRGDLSDMYLDKLERKHKELTTSLEAVKSTSMPKEVDLIIDWSKI